MTTPMTTDALNRGARGAGATILGQVATMGIQFLGTIILSRLLAPEDFGLVAMVTVFVGVGELLRDFGMPTAALQSRELSNQQASNVFWITGAMSLAVAVILTLCTPLLVALYDEPRLSSIVPVMASVLLLNGLQAQYQVRLARSMRYVALAGNSVVARSAGLAIGIFGALVGWGYWAIVAQLVSQAFILLVGSGILTRWLPTRPRRGSDSLRLIRAGAHFGGAQVLTFAADNVDTLMIGAVWGPQALGQYNRAFQLFMLPITAIFSPLTNVVVPTINRAVAEGRNPSGVLIKIQTAVCGLSIWLLLITAATAPWLIPLLLGDQWTLTIPLIQILSLGGAFRALSQTNYWAYIVHQQSRQLFLSNTVTKPLQVILIVGAAFISVEAVAWAYVLGRAITWPINLIWLWRTAGQNPIRFGLNGVRLLFAACAGFVVTTFALNGLAIGYPAISVVVGAVIATVVYFGAILLTPSGYSELRTSAVILKAAIRRG
ncbi:lipopolysaccharide biosynthesis protein [Microbacterium trichothecenolyticum]|uniref:lipopolysaccharide biosynthesis protein n=1 Tax=Microbacterium trichothecenolyticum TaxID=69370 RepID=UPI001C6F4E34|nr:lipopolysaccharide biosynthesis protein [Microbacterium trichothecenolyticum]MBW9122397.1 lipopolysaccharide biosynthesis protein [Microbacterium trichothecenolyticum]